MYFCGKNALGINRMIGKDYVCFKGEVIGQHILLRDINSLKHNEILRGQNRQTYRTFKVQRPYSKSC